jgi:hypothetical protein
VTVFPNRFSSNPADLVDEWHRAGSWNQTWITIRLCIEVFERLGAPEAAAQLLGAMKTSATAGPIHGADAGRIASTEATLTSRLGDATYHALAARGAALGDDGAIALARRILGDLIGSAPQPARVARADNHPRHAGKSLLPTGGRSGRSTAPPAETSTICSEP